MSQKFFEKRKAKENKLYDEIMGKYLFFHEDPKMLLKIAVDEIKGDFHVAKVNQMITGTGKEYVLCLYYKDDSRKYELNEKYQEKNGVKYRFWKSDEDTRKGKYSKQFLDNQKKK
ncbi:MAG: hypothetical protein IIC67_01175 [Thaumarchaeota archaeon]|nr:hypothetical protein [Nitrososphaerota archaeon]